MAAESVHSHDASSRNVAASGKRWLWPIAITAAVVVGLLLAPPYWSAAGLLKAAADEDVPRAAGFIQERRVERTIGDQASEAVQTQALKARDKGWPGAEAALESDKSPPLAAELSNPRAVTDLIRTHIPANGSRLAAAWSLARSDSSVWASAGTFSVAAPGGYVFTWKRRGLGWQLVNVEIPQHVIEAAAISGEQPIIEPEVEVFKHP